MSITEKKAYCLALKKKMFDINDKLPSLSDFQKADKETREKIYKIHKQYHSIIQYSEKQIDPLLRKIDEEQQYLQMRKKVTNAALQRLQCSLQTKIGEFQVEIHRLETSLDFYNNPPELLVQSSSVEGL